MSEEQQVEGSGQGRSGWEPQIPGSSLVFYPPRGISGLTSKPPRVGKLSNLRFCSAHTTFPLLVNSYRSFQILLLLFSNFKWFICNYSIAVLM